MANDSNLTTFISLNNQPYMTRPTLINKNPDDYNPGLHYSPCIVNLDRSNGGCNTLDHPSVPNKRDVNLSVFNMITTIKKH